MAILKQIDITNLDTNVTSSNPLGAEAENIDISRDSSGDITDVAHQDTSESLNTTLGNIEDKLNGVSKNFVGTLAEWNALTDEEKAEYDTYDMIDEYNTIPIDNSLSDNSSNPVQNRIIKSALDKTYNTDDTTSSTINDTDYIPMSESGGTKKKTLWSTIVSKIKNVLTKSDVGLGNVENLDQSFAIKNITRSGTTFTATRLNDTTFTFTQQDNTGSDTRVTEYSTTTDNDYRVLLSYYADDDNDTTYVRKHTDFKYNPSTGNLQVIQINGTTVGSSPEFTDNKVTQDITTSSSTLPILLSPSSSNYTGNTLKVAGSTFGYNPNDGHMITPSLSILQDELALKTSSTSSDDSSDIVWYYGNDQEKARLWTDNTYSKAQGLNYRLFDKDGNKLVDESLLFYRTGERYSFDGIFPCMVAAGGAGGTVTLFVPKKIVGSNNLTNNAKNITITWLRCNGGIITSGITITGIWGYADNRLSFDFSLSSAQSGWSMCAGGMAMNGYVTF